MADVVEQAVAELRDAGAQLAPGLSVAERATIEARWRITFSADHARLLELGVPVGEGWVDWRGSEDRIRARLQAPVAGLLFDVTHNGFWPASWGARPDDPDAASEVALACLLEWPRLVPLYGHRYLPPGPHPSPSPVLSVVQSDVIRYGCDLLEWVRREFLGVPLPEPRPGPDVPHWSRLASGCDDAEL